MKFPKSLAVLLSAVAIRFSASAEMFRLQPIADTTLIEAAPDNNMGGTEFVNAGTAGANGGRNRALFKFDFSAIPAGAKITRAAVTLEVTREPGAGSEISSFALHRLLKDWGEGDKNSLSGGAPGLGLSAEAGEATWNSPFALTTNSWTEPGAVGDFAATPSSTTVVLGVGDFPLFDSTAEMISDVQFWVEHPNENFGWLLKTESESTQRTARGFGSREFVGGDTNSPPYVEVEFVAPLAVSNPKIEGNQFQFSFQAEANQSYAVEFKNALGTNAWLTLTNFNAFVEPTNVVVFDLISTNARFYRVVAP